MKINNKKETDSNRSIMRATAVLGSSSFIQLLSTVLRTKLLAILLGPAGVGLAGVLNNFMTTSSMFFDMGTGTSATREVAKANKALNRSDSIGKAKIVVIRLSWLLGCSGCILTILLAKPISQWVLGENSYAHLIQVIALGTLFNVVANVQIAFLNGLRRVGDLAKCTVLGSILGTLVAITIAWKYRETGVVYFVISVPIISYAVTSFFIWRLRLKSIKVPIVDFSKQALDVMKLGMPLMLAAVLGQLTMLAVRGQIVVKLGLPSAGLFEVAWGITGTYIGLVLSAMVREYYPRLVTLTDDPEATNNAVNKQSLMAIWLTTPLLLGLSSLAPLAIKILYTSDFLLITNTLRWMAIGTVLKVVVWSMGFVWLARGLTRYVMFDAVVGNLILFGGVTLFLDYYGINFIGWLYIFNYVVAFFYTFLIINKITGFRIQPKVISEIILLLATCSLSIPLNFFITPLQAMIIGGSLTAVLSARALLNLYDLYLNK